MRLHTRRHLLQRGGTVYREACQPPLLRFSPDMRDEPEIAQIPGEITVRKVEVCGAPADVYWKGKRNDGTYGRILCVTARRYYACEW